MPLSSGSKTEGRGSFISDSNPIPLLLSIDSIPFSETVWLALCAAILSERLLNRNAANVNMERMRGTPRPTPRPIPTLAEAVRPPFAGLVDGVGVELWGVGFGVVVAGVEGVVGFEVAEVAASELLDLHQVSDS